MNFQNIINDIFEQQKKLLLKIPNIQNYFVPIFIPAWQVQIPFLPIRAFRDFDLHSSFTEEKSEEYKIFLSSGSTGNKRSRHIFSQSALKNYELNTSHGFLNFLTRHNLSQKIPIISLVPPSSLWPTSSLSAMIEMFAKNGFIISWCNIDQRKENLIDILKSLPSQSSCLIFGTTFHHLMLANYSNISFKEGIQKEFIRLNVSIVDTGGTKGRTQALTLKQSIEVLNKFYISANFSFLSEYGMCELGSQAWSTKKIHDGSFIANNSLFPFAVSIEKNTALAHGEKGFIAFIDTVNTESWQAVITEDIGYTKSENEFYLIGRGPDATIKGCSLNVRNIFSFDEIEREAIIEVVQNDNSFCGNENRGINLNFIYEILKERYGWDKYSIHDLKMIASSIHKGIPTDNKYRGKNLFIISAANTPIAWLFPYLIAAHSGVFSVTIKVPSLRLDDFYAESVIQKTKNLIQLFSYYFPNTKTYIDQNKSIAQTFSKYDIILTFGNNETLQTISEQIDKSKTEFIGKGDIKNSLLIDPSKDKVRNIVDLCSLWNGRGCLTPVVLFCEDDIAEIDSWVEEFAKELEIQFLERFFVHKLNFLQGFVHSHNCAFVRGQIKSLGYADNERIFRGSLTCVVNLTKIPEEKFKEFNLELSFGGCGFVYLLPAKLKTKNSSLSRSDILPEI